MGWRTRLLLATVCAVAVASVYAGQPVLGPMGRDLGVPVDALGWFVAAGQLGYLAGLVLLVPLGDMLDRRRLIAVHLALVAAGTAITAAAPAAWAAFSGLAAAGVFAVVVQTAVAYTASVSPPEERGRNLGIVTSGVVIGILGARVVAGVLADLWGWRSIYLTLALLAGVLAVLSVALLPADVRSSTTRYGQVVRSFGALFIQPVFLSRGLIAFFLFASFGTLWSGMALPLAGAPWHLSQTQIGLFGVAGLAGALGAARSGRWGDAGHARRVTGAALVLLLVSWVAIGQLPWSLPLLIVGVVLLDFAVQAVHVSNQHTLTASFSDRTSTTIGAYMVFYSLGSALGAAATTALFDAAGWTGPTLLGAAFTLCALVVWAWSGLRLGSAILGKPVRFRTWRPVGSLIDVPNRAEIRENTMSAATMKAVRFDEYGDIDVLRVDEVERPTPGPRQVLVKVAAAAVNPGEKSIRTGILHDMWPATFPSGQGSDLAGTVAEVGAEVDGFAVGEEVFGFTDHRASHAEYVVVEAGDLAHRPPEVPLEQAASLYVAGTTAYAELRAVGLQAGDTVVITAAAGGVGSIAVQLAVQAGATVVGLASEPNHQWLRDHGAVPVAYGEGVAERIKAAVGGVNAFVDNFGGGYVELALELGVSRDRINTIDRAAAAEHGTKAEGNAEAADIRVVTELADLIRAGRLEIPIAATYPLAQVRDAFRELEKRHTRGKIVLKP